jgi:hypothetical protein
MRLWTSVDHAWVMIPGLFDPREIVDSIGFFGLVDNVPL